MYIFHDKIVATATIDSDTPAINDGSTCAQSFSGTNSPVSYVYDIKTDQQFVNTLEENIHARSEISKLISARAQSEVISSAQSILWDLFIYGGKSEPHYQHHNFVESCYQIFKRITNIILELKDDPSYTWIIDLTHVCLLLNHTHDTGINNMPTTKAKVPTSDISPLFCFRFW